MINANGIYLAIDGMAKAFGMGVDFATALGVIAIMFSGDVQSLTWSIGKLLRCGLFLKTL